MNIEVTDQLLQQLTEEWLDTLPERYPSRPKHPYRVSPGFRLKMWQLTHKADWDYSHGKDMSAFGTARTYHLTKRSMAALLAAALGTTVAMAYASRYFQMIREDYEKYSSIYYQQVEDGYVPGEFIEYALGYIPAGFVLEHEVTIDEFHEEVYICVEDKNLVLTFHQTEIGQATLDIDTEKVEPVEIFLNDKQSAWYLGNAGHKVIYWDNGEYLFQVSGGLSKEELIKVANSIYPI